MEGTGTMNDLANRPSGAALGVAAFFRPSTLLIGLVGFVAGIYFWSFLIWLVTAVIVGVKIGTMVNDARFAAQVAGEGSLGRPGLPPGPAREALSDHSLRGVYLEAFERTRDLKRALVADVQSLPVGPAKSELETVLPQLEEAIGEVQQLAHEGQKLELELSGGLRENVEAEIKALDERIAREADATQRGELEIIREKKRETLGHHADTAKSLEKIKTQLQKIVSTLEEAHARTRSLKASLGADPGQVNQVVTDISNEVKYLAKGVEETNKLLSEK